MSAFTEIDVTSVTDAQPSNGGPSGVTADQNTDTPDCTPLAVRMEGLAIELGAAHAAAQSAMQAAVAHAIQAGELLLQAKAVIPHGEFGEWCRSLPFSESMARGYMRLARLDPANRQRVADLPLRQALENIAGPEQDDDLLACANAFAIRCDAAHRTIRLRLGVLKRILDDPDASIEELAFAAQESAECYAQARSLGVEAMHGVGRCLAELKTLTGRGEADLLRALNDGSLL
ncbi:MAG: DUF3102 domain-containing protein [Sulfuritalea sp.]|nr:DUF3102 domain-containing protein [Sulfuritalea sp.]